MSESKITFQIKAYRKKALRDAYGASRYLFNQMIASFKNELGDTPGYFYTPKQVELIVSRLGIPGKLEVLEKF